MKKQLVIIGIACIFVCVGLSGCNEEDTSRLGPSNTQEPNFYMSNGGNEDNCSSTFRGNGKVWINYTITNTGAAGEVKAYAQVYQGIENYQFCGNGTIYNQTQQQNIYLSHQESRNVTFLFTGVNCATGTSCYGNRVWMDW